MFHVVNFSPCDKHFHQYLQKKNSFARLTACPKLTNTTATGAASKLGQANLPHIALPVSFVRDPISLCSHLSGVYARGSKISHTGGTCVTCRGLVLEKDNSGINLSRVTSRMGCLE